jgi:hypothetical protein
MKCHGTKHCGTKLAATGIILVGALLARAPAAHAILIVNDSWADGGRTDGPDPLDAPWFGSTSSAAIEVSVGDLGLVTGTTNGRGIHGIFAPQTLTTVGDNLTATFTLTTPVTVGTNKPSAFRVGLFDTTGKPGLAADITASNASPNAIYNNLNGYMLEYDVNTSSPKLTFLRRTNASSGQLMAVATDYTAISSGGSAYSFSANTSYTGVFSVTKTVTGLDLTGSLSLTSGPTLLSTFTASEATPTTSTFGMLAFHALSATFGSSGTVNQPDNGIDFTNIQIDSTVTSVPEASSLALLAVVGLFAQLSKRLRGRLVKSNA